MLTTPLEVDDIVAGEMLWCGFKSLVSSTAILAVAALLGAVDSPTALLCLPVLFLCGLCFAGPALVMSALSPSYDFFNYYFTVFMTPMFIFSGVFYPVDTLPELGQAIVEVLPLKHAIDLVRPLVAGQPLTDPLLHLGVLAAYALGGYYVATVLVRRRLVR
jgi:lipooligosaccharide transport system permease protein